MMKKLMIIVISCIALISCILLMTSCQNVPDQKNKKARNTDELKAVSTPQKPVEEKNTDIRSGLLLGLAKESSDNTLEIGKPPYAYRTLWIYEKDQQLTYKEIKNGIIVPYGNEFWKLENNKFVLFEKNEAPNKSASDLYQEYNFYHQLFLINSHLVSEKGEDLYNKKAYQDKFFKEEGRYLSFLDTTEYLTFVGNKYVCIKSNHYETGGGTLRIGFESVKMYTIDQLANAAGHEKGVKLIDLLGTDTKEKLMQFENKYNKVISKDKLYQEEQKVEGEQLLLKRQDGKWRVQVPVYNLYYHDGNGSSFQTIHGLSPADIKIPDSLTSHDSLCVSWDKIKQKIPQAKDAVSSPSKNIFAVLTDKNILIFLNPEGVIDKPYLTITADEKENIVLNQWATGEFVDKWSKLFDTYK